MSLMKRSAVIGIIVFLASTVLPGPLGAAESQEKDAVAYKQAYNLVLQEKWADALKAMEEMVKNYSKSAWVDDARFWQCYAREKLNQSQEEIFRCYQEFINAYADSEWADDARANMVRVGSALAKAGKHEYEAKIQAMEEDQETDVKLAALYALKALGDLESLPTLISLYDTAKLAQLKSQIIFMLQDFKSSEAFVKLKSIALSDPDPQARRMALISM